MPGYVTRTRSESFEGSEEKDTRSLRFHNCTFQDLYVFAWGLEIKAVCQTNGSG